MRDQSIQWTDSRIQPPPDEAALRREALASARAYIARRKAEEARPQIMPQDLMRELRTGFNLSCSLLEELAAAGELEVIRTTGGLQAFIPAPAAQPVGRGYALPLSQKEASHLLNLLDWYLGRQDPKDGWASATASGHVTILREVRSRLKGGPL